MFSSKHYFNCFLTDKNVILVLYRSLLKQNWENRVKYALIFSFLLNLCIANSSEDKVNSIKNNINNKTPNMLLNCKMPEIIGTTTSGVNVDSSYFEGNVVLINFLYIGCKPCMKEAVTLNKMFDDYNSKGLKILSIAAHTISDVKDFVNFNDSISIFSQLRRANKIDTIKYDIMAECPDKKTKENRDTDVVVIGTACNTISSKFNLEGYPLTVLIDKNGIIRFVQPGFSISKPELFYEILQKEIDKLLK